MKNQLYISFVLVISVIYTYKLMILKKCKMKTYNYDITKDKLQDVISSDELQQIVKKDSILVQLFCGEGDKKAQEALIEINSLFENAVIIGSSTDGEIIEGSVQTNTTVVSISVFEQTTLKSGYVDYKDGYKNGVMLAKKITTPKTKLLILFVDGLLCNGEEFLNGVYSIAPHVIVAGGLSADNSEFIDCNVYHKNCVYHSGAVGVSLEADELYVTNLYSFGWKSIGRRHTVTKSVKNRVYSIDGINAVDFYKKYLGEDVDELFPSIAIEFPLLLKKNGTVVGRAATQKHDDGSLSFAGNVPEGEDVFLGMGSAETILENKIIKMNSNMPVEAFFIYSCMARRRFMPDLIYKEFLPFANQAPTSGFFTYGEFYTEQKHELFNQALTAVAVSECKKCLYKSYLEKSTHVSSDRTIKAISHLMEQTTKEYDEIYKALEKKIDIVNKSSKLSVKNFNLLLETMKEGVVICVDEQIADVNPSMTKMSGYSREELLNGISLKSLMQKESVQKIEKCLKSNKSFNFEANLLTKDNKIVNVLIESKGVEDKKNVRISTFIDVTELKKKDLLLIQQSHLAQLGEMLSMIAHQWRQPLNTISATAIKMSMQNHLGLLNSEELEKSTSFIESVAQKMSKIINDFMNFAKPNNSKEIIDANEIFDDIVPIIDAQLKIHNIEINIQKNATKQIITYKKELEQVLLNLLTNARDALDDSQQPEKKISVEISTSEQDCIISIADNAKGIPTDIIKRIFEPYFTTKEEGKGTGLGLYMNKKIVEEHLNGKISGKNQDIGAKFTIKLKNCVSENLKEEAIE